MLVYGDRTRRADPHVLLAKLRDDLSACWGLTPGLERHTALIDAFILAGDLAVGLADAEVAALGEDDLSPTQETAMDLLLALAHALDRSWRSHFAELGGSPVRTVDALAALPLPDAVDLKLAEGFAYYAVYPEAYLEAARALTEPPTVIGLRSIGAPLAALVAAASGAARPFTLRPGGHPFDRRPRVSARLENAILAQPAGMFAIVDEGPGLSGSSFGGVANWLMELGVDADRILFFPSHQGEPGREAQPAQVARWRSTRREVRTFDDLFLDAPERPRLLEVFAAVSGEPVTGIEDLSGGAWREGLAEDVPAFPSQERRKFRLRTPSGAWLLKFAGLGAEGQEKLERARALHAAGFSPQPLALRHGLLIERWEEGAQPLDAAPPLQHLADYIAFRARAFPAEGHGAPLADLSEMARANIAEALGDEAAAAILSPWRAGDIARLQAEVRPVHVDGRLHRWEWLTTSGGLLKTDSVDHSTAHNLVGPQDAAWDVAGAVVDFDLDSRAAGRLQTLVAERVAVSPALTALMLPCYAAFQLGLWTFAAAEDAAAARQRDYYSRWLTVPGALRVL